MLTTRSIPTSTQNTEIRKTSRDTLMKQTPRGTRCLAFFDTAPLNEDEQTPYLNNRIPQRPTPRQ